MNPRQIRAIFPNASESTIRANADGVSQGSEPKSLILHESLAKEKRKAGNPTRRVVSITSYRQRLCDPDNLVGKYFVDSLRYANILLGDREEDIVYQICQKKVSNKAQEKTLIQIS